MIVPFLLLFFGIGISECFHAYNQTIPFVSNKGCKPFNESTRPIKSWSLDTNEYNIWLDLGINKYTGKSLYGFEDAMRVIWKHQHPPDCLKAKFLISDGWHAGIGSVVHVEGIALALAIELGRVLLTHPAGPVRQGPRTKGFIADNGWQVDVPFCKEQNIKTWDCYFEPWSNCNITHALQGKPFSKIPEIYLEEKELKSGHIPRRFFTRPLSAVRTVIYVNQPIKTNFIPGRLLPIVHCSPMAPAFRYYWWRAVSAAYIVRPNVRTISELRKYDIFEGKNVSSCIAMHIRRGDKVGGPEMVVQSVMQYLSTAERLWQEGGVRSGSSEPPVVFVGSEDADALQQVERWGEINGWKVLYTDMFNRSAVSARLHLKELLTAVQQKKAVHHDLEFLSILANLQFALRCDAWVCTLASNSCRLVDELRATVASKADRIFADLSPETCAVLPCIGGNFTSFGW